LNKQGNHVLLTRKEAIYLSSECPEVFLKNKKELRHVQIHQQKFNQFSWSVFIKIYLLTDI